MMAIEFLTNCIKVISKLFFKIFEPVSEIISPSTHQTMLTTALLHNISLMEARAREGEGVFEIKQGFKYCEVSSSLRVSSSLPPIEGPDSLIHTLGMKDAIESGLYLALISMFGAVALRYVLSTKLGLKCRGQ